MKIQITFEVCGLVASEDKANELEEALHETASKFATGVSVNETNAEEVEDED